MAAAMTYARGDERPAWVASFVLDGAEDDDYSTGFTFAVRLTQESTVVTPTPTFFGSVGSVSVQWATGDLNIAEGVWIAQLTVTRTSDQAQFTVTDTIRIRPRALAGP